MIKIIAVVIKYNCEIKEIPGLEMVIIDNSPPNINLGFGAAANIGIKKALEKGADKILLLNPDVKITTDEIKKIKDGDIVSPVLKFKRDGKWVYDYGGKVNWFIGRTTHDEKIAASLSAPRNDISYVSGACMLVKREVFEKIGFFDEKFFLYFEDVDFCLRAKQAGFTVGVDNLVIEHKIEEQRETHDVFKMKQNLKSNWAFIIKWIPWYFKPLAISYMFVRWVREIIINYSCCQKY